MLIYVYLKAMEKKVGLNKGQKLFNDKINKIILSLFVGIYHKNQAINRKSHMWQVNNIF